jgi:hypothetical protein
VINAGDILSSKVFDDAITEIRKDLWEKFQSVPAGDKEQLQELSLKSWALREFVGELERRMTSSVETRINQGKV